MNDSALPPPPNRLALEKSPYLQQHATNPVDWYPWGEEAFAAARAQNKPIFLSIGYSTCHWCHVMAHESFENLQTADVMNRHYINIKLDREERPDVDAIYMSAVQALTGSGGWPMSVWLTPDLKPFYGGTYFPPDERWGRPGFASIMEQLAQIFRDERERVTESAAHMADFLRPPASPAGGDIPASADVDRTVFGSLVATFDAANGGFSPAPKFPMPVYLEFLLDYNSRFNDTKALEMALFTYRKMAEGGLYDHLAGGFARYSTDGKWLVPHFEKMLYDNAQIVRSGAALWAQSGDDFLRATVTGTVAYLLKDLCHANGGFFSAEDADSEGKEGTFYLWMLTDLHRLFGDDAPAVAARFGVTVDGNFMDPHTRETGMNVLSLAGPAPAGLDMDAVRATMLADRERRPRPHRDEKIITEWNGLAISALAKAGFTLNEPAWIAAAERTADFLTAHLYDRSTRTLFRRWRDGHRAVEGQLGDHAMFVEGLIDLFEATGDPARLALAIELHDIQNELFFDTEAGGFFMGRSTPDLFVRLKEDADNVIPSGNATAVSNAFRLLFLTGNERFRESAMKTLGFFSQSLKSRPYSLTRLASCLAWAEGLAREIVVTGTPENPVSDLLDVLRRSRPRDSVVVLAIDPARRANLEKILPASAPLAAAPGSPAAFVCRRFACLAPSRDAAAFAAALRA